MNLGIIATRYARAIYEYAAVNSCETAIYKEMNVLNQNFEKFPNLQKALIDPTVTNDKKIKLLLTACGIKINPVLEKSIAMIVENGRADYMANIALKYVELYRKAKSITIVSLTTVDTSGEEIEKALLDIIPKKENDTIEFHTKDDSSIIGGFVLEIGDKRMDASVKTQLNQLKLDLTD
ncbi:F-type H+-transporting ATPase subunit delta [Dysgonomonadaceae bacterium PH5-43]|nr:F-type H+-transporting ATPase subunit delta [Dysgonomonadaceae bacterium PH5-43]